MNISLRANPLFLKSVWDGYGRTKKSIGHFSNDGILSLSSYFYEFQKFYYIHHITFVAA